MLTSLEIRTLIPLISACDSLNEAKTILWKGFDTEKPVMSRDAFYRVPKENAKNVFTSISPPSHILRSRHTVKKKKKENNPHNLLMEVQESLKNILKLFHVSVACKSRCVITSYGKLRGNHRKPLKLTKNNSFIHKDVRNVKL